MTAIPLTTCISVATSTTAAFNTATTVAVTTAIASSQQRNNHHDQSINLLQKYFQLPQPIRFLIAGALGNIIFFAIERVMFNDILPRFTDHNYYGDGSNGDTTQKSIKIMSYILNEHTESTSFFVSYLIQIIAQHLLNAVLVFGWETINTKEKYWNTLVGVYSAYSTTLLVSTVLNALLIQIGIPKYIAFWGTLLSTGILNYYLLNWLATRKQAVEKDNGSLSMKRRSVRTSTAAMVSRGGGSGSCQGRMFQRFDEKGRESIILSATKSMVSSILLESKNQSEEEILQFVRSL